MKDSNMQPIVLFVNHKPQQCGVYEFGRMIGLALSRSGVFRFEYVECDTWQEFQIQYDRFAPKAVIYNYYTSTMPWITRRIRRYGKNCFQTAEIDTPQICIFHEGYQARADFCDNTVFDYFILPDPTLLLRNPIVYKTGRLVPDYDVPQRANDVPTIGSFGFATHNKGFARIVERVQAEFDRATIRINISIARFGDEQGAAARRTAAHLRGALVRPGISLEISHTHFDEKGLLNFLAANDINVFLYDYQKRRGIASVTDWALAAGRPIVISKSGMFRHLFGCYPSICIEDRAIRDILKTGFSPLERVRAAWSAENLVWDYERIVRDVLRRRAFAETQPAQTPAPIPRKPVLLRHRLDKPLFLLGALTRKQGSPWVSRSSTLGRANFTQETYLPTTEQPMHLNRMLDNVARLKYAPAIAFIERVVPEVARKKIPAANVQQGFVFDTAVRMARTIGDACSMLAVGAFEDTAYLTLHKMGFPVEAVDPVINYDLATFMTRPDVKPDSYDLILATSVIEHVEDDVGFVRDISRLLKPGGTAILTCDFHNGYRSGVDIPAVNFRFYAKRDILDRLMPSIPACELYGDAPEWDCDSYDFLYQQKYRYGFASIVFRKKSVGDACVR